jgi:hypothetical protein
MSVSDVMNTMMTQDATATMSADVTSGSQPSGIAGSKPMVKSVEDVMSLYDDYGDDSEASSNGVKLKEDKTTIPDELNNTVPKELNSEKKTEEKEEKTEESVPETSKDVIKESNELPKTVKVKVNGAETEVPLQDVINSYSGQQEIQRRFTEFDKTKKAFESERKEMVGMNDYVKQEIGELRSSFDSLISQYQKNGYMEKNPLEAVNQLLDKMGINSNLFERAVFEHQLPDYAKYFNMTDVERDAYYTKKENDYLRKKEQGFTERDQQVKFREENQRKDFELITNAGLDSVKYDELQSELLEAGHKDLNAEKVVEYAKQKPTLDKVVKVFEELGTDPLQDKRTQTVFNLLKEFPETSIEEILDHMDPKRAALKSAQVLAAKAPKVNRVSSAKGQDSDLDEMLNYYKN